MKISAFQINNNYNFGIKPNINTNKLERTPSKDIVSFSSKKEPKKKLSKNIETALEFGHKVINRTALGNLKLEDVEAIAQEYAQGVEVLPISELEGKIENSQDYGAFFQSQLKADFTPSTSKMYIGLPKKSMDEMARLLYAKNASHEFTHLVQMNTNESCDLLKLLSKGNYEYAKLLMGLSDTIFSVFDNQLQADAAQNVFRNDIDMMQLRKYRELVPREAYVSKHLLAKNIGLSSEREMQDYLKEQYNRLFNQVMVSVKSSQPELLDMIPKNETLENLRKKVRVCCALKAKNEFEAYTTESELAKELLKTDNTINIDAFPMYYSILESAFK